MHNVGIINHCIITTLRFIFYFKSNSQEIYDDDERETHRHRKTKKTKENFTNVQNCMQRNTSRFDLCLNEHKILFCLRQSLHFIHLSFHCCSETGELNIQKVTDFKQKRERFYA